MKEETGKKIVGMDVAAMDLYNCTLLEQGIKCAEWQPIETAPKDGTPILGYADGIMTTVEWAGDYWSLCVCVANADDEWNPTHWQCLPDGL